MVEHCTHVFLVLRFMFFSPHNLRVRPERSGRNAAFVDRVESRFLRLKVFLCQLKLLLVCNENNRGNCRVGF